jgi:hypothetical protein
MQLPIPFMRTMMHPTRFLPASCHSFAGHCTCALILVLNPRIPYVNQFVYRLYPRSPPPRNLLEGDFIFLTLSFNNAPLCSLNNGPQPHATRGFLPLYFYDSRTNCLILNRIRDNPAQRTLTSISYSDSTGMTVEACVNFCNDHYLVLAGLANGQDCCECTSRRCLQGGL